MKSLSMKGTVVAGIAGLVAYALAVRPWHLRWGATNAEVQEPLPGDEVVPEPELSATHAVTIHAAIAAVWPWLVQVGQGQGGFYSYVLLEPAHLIMERKMLLAVKARAAAEVGYQGRPT